MLENGKCVVCNMDKPQDLGCKVWDWPKQICYECSDHWYYKEGQGCVPVSEVCKGADENGACTACYKGYHLENGACVLSDVKGPTDLGCKTWDWDNQKCLACSFRWTMDAYGKCVPVNDNCAVYDAAGICTTCYSGYSLNNGQC